MRLSCGKSIWLFVACITGVIYFFCAFFQASEGKREANEEHRSQPVFHATFPTTLHLLVAHILHLTGSRIFYHTGKAANK